MTSTPQPPDRIPITHSVVYAVRGLPEVPNKHGAGTLEPREITLTYRAARDSQLGRVHAYVAGRIWVNGAELPLLPGGLYGQHYDDGLDGWPEWLAEEARLHDPASLTDLRYLVVALAEDLRYVLNYRGPGHDHERPGVWDTSGEPCEHCARLAVAQQNLAAYQAQQQANCNHSFPDPFPDPLDRIGNCRHCDVSYQDAKAQRLAASVATEGQPEIQHRDDCSACRHTGADRD